MVEITFKLTDDELRALEELAKLEGRSVTEQAAHILRKDLNERKFIKSNVNESNNQRFVRLDE